MNATQSKPVAEPVADGTPPPPATIPAAIIALLHPDPTRFTARTLPDGSGIVDDPLTGLQWAQAETDELDWDEADAACRACRLGGCDDWRMPTREELQTILDLSRHEPCLPSVFTSHGEWVWTATQTPWTRGKAGSSRSFFYVYVAYGGVLSNYADSQLRARPVRRAVPASQCSVIGQA